MYDVRKQLSNLVFVCSPPHFPFLTATRWHLDIGHHTKLAASTPKTFNRYQKLKETIVSYTRRPYLNQSLTVTTPLYQVTGAMARALSRLPSSESCSTFGLSFFTVCRPHILIQRLAWVIIYHSKKPFRVICRDCAVSEVYLRRMRLWYLMDRTTL